MNNYFAIRTVLETPICDDYKWSKVPHLPADALILDMEDSAAPALKPQARARVVEYLAKPEYFGHRPVIARCNAFDTEWGRDDVVALARAHAPALAYPKTRSVDDLTMINDIFRREGAPPPDLFPIIETAEGLLGIDDIAGCPGVKGLWFGPADLAIDTGFDWFVDGDVNRDAFYYPKMRLVLTGAPSSSPQA